MDSNVYYLYKYDYDVQINYTHYHSSLEVNNNILRFKKVFHDTGFDFESDYRGCDLCGKYISHTIYKYRN